VHNRGRIIEEDHYYAFGLKIAGISSNKLGNDSYEGHLQNKNLYNDKELIDEADFDWYDYGFRNYDAQIGRFPQLDPLTDDYPYYTPYQYAGNEPIANVDLDGLEPLPAVTVTTYISKSATQSANLTSAGLRAALTASNAGVRVGLDGVKVNMNQPRPVNNTPYPQSSYLSPAKEPFSFVDQQRYQSFRRQQYLNAGLNSDGSETPLYRLAGNKTFTRAANNLVFPVITLGGLISGAGEVVQGVKMVGTETANGAAFLEDLVNLRPTHYLTRSKSQMQELINDIRVNGIRESIEYVEFNGQKYIVGGNHRYFAAQRLGIRQVPVKKVKLPFAGYKTVQDLMLEGKMPGYWKFLK
jgi:RHS repeat-associated protein